MIGVKGLHKSFGEKEVLTGIDEHVEQGEKVAVIGPSGSGKSTFLRCLNLLEAPTAGEIWFEGELINTPGADINRIRQKMGMVFQHFNLFPHLNVRQNITLAPVLLKLQTSHEADENARRLLERIGLSDKENEYPNMLSGGQKQRIAIVRALAMKPTKTRAVYLSESGFPIRKTSTPTCFRADKNSESPLCGRLP